MAFSGVRSSWLMVARNRVLDASACSAAVRASSSACSWTLRSVTSRITATTSASERGLLERPATHLDPDEIGGNVLAANRIAAETEFDAARLAAARGIRQRREIGRTIGDMDAVEQAVAGEPRNRRAEHGFRRRRNELHGAVAAVTRNHVAHVSREQAIAVFLDIEQRHARCAPAIRRQTASPAA